MVIKIRTKVQIKGLLSGLESAAVVCLIVELQTEVESSGSPLLCILQFATRTLGIRRQLQQQQLVRWPGRRRGIVHDQIESLNNSQCNYKVDLII